ncbi:MAG: DNA gyrase subunit A, partial [Nanoarchaeota archaeon]|nr:DNA gyrase subunit A [Nanoarchaeota archaeon]
FFSKKKKDRLATIKGLNKLRMSKTDNIPFLNNYLRDNYAETFIQKNNFDRYNLLEKNYEKLIKIIKPSDKKLVDWIKTKRFFFNRIKRINVLPAENVYSIKVNSACHSFVGNGFINHNTEAKLSKISDEILSEIGQDTVDFTENFDGTLKEPQVLPSKIPNLLVNGSSGIAVGMATSIPPHNLSEVCKGVIQLIEQPDTDVVELIKIIKGPDFPTGGIITGTSGFVQAYHSGRGRIRVKSVIDIEERKNKRQIVIKEIPYMVNKSLLVEEIANRIREKRIEGVSDLRDESDKDGVRVILELRGSANVDVVKNQLLKTTRAQDTFSMILLSLVNNEPKILTLKQMLQEFLSFRQQVVRRRTEFELKKAQSRAHIIEGIIICLDNIEDVVELIKKSRSADEAKKGLNTKYDLSEKQCQAVLDMKLQRLTGLEQEKLRQELKDLLERIKELKEILASETKIFEIIKTELQEMISKYGDDRRTSIEEGDDEDIDIEDLIVEEEQVVTLSNQGYIKRLPDETYRVQRRGGKGKIGAIHDEDDFIEKVFIANTHSYLLCFSDRGKVHWLKVYKIPEASRYGKGKAIVNLVELPKGEKITQVIPVKEFKEGNYLMMATKKGIIKKSALNAYSKPRHGGIRAINLAEDDELIGAVLGDETQYIMLATSDGRAVRFTEKSIRSIGRTGKGVRGIKVRGNDYVVGMVLASEDDKLFTMTENGYGKRTNISEYRLINRGGSGVRNIICSPRNGKVVTVKAVNDTDEIILMSKKGIALRIAAGTISTIGRNTQGMRIMKLGSGDRVVSTALIPGNGEAEE